MNSIEIDKISKNYGKNLIFRELSHVFKPGVNGVSGPNGSGKSTLMRCLAGLLNPDSGHVRWKLQDRSLENKERCERLGFSAPYIQFYAGLTCLENLRLVQELNGMDSGEASISEILERVGLAEKVNEFYGRMSSGQQQRLRLAGALIKKPDFLLLDEPGTNLDRSGYGLVREIVSGFAASGAVVILASNDPEELALCDGLIRLEDFK